MRDGSTQLALHPVALYFDSFFTVMLLKLQCNSESVAGVLFIISDDFILALLSYLFEFYFGVIVLFVGCFNTFCFICFL